ncbi:MAG: urea carboxylase-associated family protein [Solirubrobacterales bacterium]|nr:urea carboxylase-associated family protein [Solirubrobacterales bacterium]
MSDPVEEVIVPAYEARTIEVKKGQTLEVVDLEGQQVGDLAAWMIDDPSEHLSPAHTVSSLAKLVPEVGDPILSNHRTPLLRIVRDDVGRHDLIVPCCDPERYAIDYDAPGHPSCLGSIQKAIAGQDRELTIEGENCWNVFMNNTVEDGRIVTREPPHPAGSAIVMEVLEDLVVALSACPQDISAVNAYNPTPMALRVTG